MSFKVERDLIGGLGRSQKEKRFEDVSKERDKQWGRAPEVAYGDVLWSSDPS